MKIGMIFECGPDGADLQVCQALGKRLNPQVVISSVPLDNKPKLIRECGKVSKQLLEVDRCAHVLIIWDLYPAWREGNVKPCRKHDRETILSSLKGAKVNHSRVTPICIQEELEAWLIADGRALSAVLSTDAHPVRVGHENRPERVRNPKKSLIRLFSRSRLRTYVDRQHAIQIVRALPDLGRLGRLPTF
ncbi:MAG: DUF4276 family protein, partial [Candidatus Acidiferrum sp.]